MRIVIALGGNALAPGGVTPTIERQRRTLEKTMPLIAQVAAEHELVVTHGNGPQLGHAALQAAALDSGNDFGLDVLDAQTAGLVGYLIEEQLANQLPSTRGCVTLLSRVVVDHDDPAFLNPTKFVGPAVDARTAHFQTLERGWRFDLDGDRRRRVVPSPLPQALPSVEPVLVLLDQGYVVVCAGGGGIPVIQRGQRLVGVEAVVDKDATSALLAEKIGADLLVLATDIEAVYDDWGTDSARPISELDVTQRPVSELAAGSMRPKVAAGARFARTGGVAVIGAIEDLAELVGGRRGTRIIDGSRSRVAR